MSSQRAYRRPPDWRPSVAEALVEAVATLEPHERYGSAIFKKAGFKDNDARHVFHSVIEHEILAYSEEPNGRRARRVAFTERGLQQALEAVTIRIQQLETFKEALLRFSGVELEPFQPATEDVTAIPEADQ